MVLFLFIIYLFIYLFSRHFYSAVHFYILFYLSIIFYFIILFYSIYLLFTFYSTVHIYYLLFILFYYFILFYIFIYYLYFILQYIFILHWLIYNISPLPLRNSIISKTHFDEHWILKYYTNIPQNPERGGWKTSQSVLCDNKSLPTECHLLDSPGLNFSNTFTQVERRHQEQTRHISFGGDLISFSPLRPLSGEQPEEFWI